MMTFQPGGGVGDQREGGGMAFREAVTPEAFELFWTCFGKVESSLL
jgi:hypothetical protein